MRTRTFEGRDVVMAVQFRRSHALGRSDLDRWLHVTFTERANGTLIRPISARAMSRKVRAVYEQAVEAHA
jgi:uncharacterized DUF497 family protein